MCGETLLSHRSFCLASVFARVDHSLFATQSSLQMWLFMNYPEDPIELLNGPGGVMSCKVPEMVKMVEAFDFLEQVSSVLVGSRKLQVATSR